MVFRFKITYEDHEDVYRYVEIKSSQSFLELHTVIQQSIGFDNSKHATFYMSDDYWRKINEISVENLKNETPKKGRIKKTEAPKNKKTIADYIDNPHQRFVYVFDPEKEWTFSIELLKIIPEEKAISYPRCIKSIGVSPKQYKPTHLTTPLKEDDVPRKSTPALSIDTEEHVPILLETDPLDEAAEVFIPLDEDGIEELTADEDKVPDGDEEEIETDGDGAEIDRDPTEQEE
jgi:Plasmid pRiA4b ORF-3-like protein